MCAVCCVHACRRVYCLGTAIVHDTSLDPLRLASEKNYTSAILLPSSLAPNDVSKLEGFQSTHNILSTILHSLLLTFWLSLRMNWATSLCVWSQLLPLGRQSCQEEKRELLVAGSAGGADGSGQSCRGTIENCFKWCFCFRFERYQVSRI